MKNINKIFAIIAFVIILPLIAIELAIKSHNGLAAGIKLSFQLLLFVVDLGNRK